MTGAVAAPPSSRSGRSSVFWLLSGQVVMFTGIAAIFPIAPLYVAAHGGGSVLIAMFVAGPLLTNTLVQVPAGPPPHPDGRRPPPHRAPAALRGPAVRVLR